MLVLTRYPAQAIFIGDEIEVAVLKAVNGKVRLGIAVGRDATEYQQLMRYPDQSVQIANGISVMVVDVRFNRVRLGIAAPRDLAIVRGEATRLHAVDSASEPSEHPPAPEHPPPDNSDDFPPNPI